MKTWSRTKSFQTAKKASDLHPVLSRTQLTSLGVGAVIGAGIFVATGVAIKTIAGPALVVSFVISGIACIFSALCYAEMAAMVPLAGSAYTYAYATMGELVAWIIGWDLLLEYAVGAAAVASGWSGYFQNSISSTRIVFPQVVSEAPFKFDIQTGKLLPTGSVFDLPAVLVVSLFSLVCVRGIRQTAKLNSVLVAVKLIVICFVILVGAFFVNPENYSPFAPFGWGGLSFFGKVIAGKQDASGSPKGVLAGAAIIFFAYIGFDSIATHTEESRNPNKDVPIAIIGSLSLCTILYVLVALVLAGMVPLQEINIHSPVSSAFESQGLVWAQEIIAVGGICGISSVLLVMLLSAARILLAMARDGLIPENFFAETHPDYKTPWKSSILVGILTAILAGFFPIDALLHLTNIGTLLSFLIVCASVPIMRRIRPDTPRPFKCPGSPWVPGVGCFLCLALMISLPSDNWWRLIVWLLIGLAIYFGYGRKHSKLNWKAEVPSIEIHSSRQSQ